MHNQRRLVIAEAGLVRIGPQEFVGRAEGAAQQEMVVHQPALQDLAARRVAVVGHHAQFGGAGKRGAAQVRLGSSECGAAGMR